MRAVREGSVEGTQVVLSWPAALALVSVAVTITVGVLKMFGMGRSTITGESLQKDINSLYEKTNIADQRITALETSVEKTVTSQISDLKDGIRRMEDKMDTLVKEVITALSALGK